MQLLQPVVEIDYNYWLVVCSETRLSVEEGELYVKGRTSIVQGNVTNLSHGLISY